MKVICDRGALLDAVGLVAAVVPLRTPSPHLSCVKVSATKVGGVGQLTLSGTDAETSLHITLSQVDVEKPGEAAIPADKLRGIVQAEEGEPTLALEVEGDVCHIRGQNAHFRVFCYPAKELPPLPDFAAAVSGKGPDVARTVFTAPAGDLLSLVTRTVFATARETSRYAINGVLLKRDGKSIEMVATDGRRLALQKATLTGQSGDGASGSVSCIVPTKALNMVQKLIRDETDVVRVAITDSRVFFAFSDAIAGSKGSDAPPRAVLSSTLVEGVFPPYIDVIPREQDKKVTASRDDLSRAIRKASVLTNEESRGVRMNFSKADRRLRLSSRAPEMGEAEIDVPLSDYAGDDIEISFNPAFLADVLKVLDQDQVIVELKSSGKPGVIRSDDNDFVYVVMPVNLPG